VSRIYFTELEADEKITVIVKVKRHLKDKLVQNRMGLLHKTKCLSITELELEKDKEKKDKKLNEIASFLYEGGKNSNLHIDLASAKVCCTCS